MAKERVLIKPQATRLKYNSKAWLDIMEVARTAELECSDVYLTIRRGKDEELATVGLALDRPRGFARH